MLQSVTVSCSNTNRLEDTNVAALQAPCCSCSVLQCVVITSKDPKTRMLQHSTHRVAVVSVMQCVAVCCSKTYRSEKAIVAALGEPHCSCSVLQ